jgi:hypothetical protein
MFHFKSSWRKVKNWTRVSGVFKVEPSCRLNLWTASRCFSKLAKGVKILRWTVRRNNFVKAECILNIL